MSSCFPLKANDEVRELIRIPSTLDNTLINSSDNPSQKYSFSGSALMLEKGRTAIEFIVCFILPLASSRDGMTMPGLAIAYTCMGCETFLNSKYPRGFV